MKNVIFFKFYLKQEQDGFVLIFAMLLLLIISFFTLTFFYLQFLEVDLIAHEIENLQAFYLAEAGRHRARKIYDDDTNDTIINFIKDPKNWDPNNNPHPYEVLIRRTDNIELSHNNQGTIISVPSSTYVRKDTDGTVSTIKGTIILSGIGIVNGNRNARRQVNMEFPWEVELGSQSTPSMFPSPEYWPKEDFGEIARKLGYTVVISELKPNLQEVITFIRKDEHEFKELSEGQMKIKLFNELSFEEQQDYREFNNYTKSEIALTRRIDKNDNELLFPEERRHLYNSPYLEEINNTNIQMLYGQDCPFELTEYRKTLGDRSIISSSSMTIKSTKEVTLKEGLYFFESLTLEKDSKVYTDGDVLIYVKKLELKENARLIGGTNKDYNNASPNDLVILAQRWDRAYQDPDDGVKIGSAAKVCGHIFAPSLKVRLSRGSKGDETRVHGSILTHQLVTYIGRPSEYGPIQIIFEQYISESEKEVVDTHIYDENGSWKEVRESLDGIL